MHWLARRKARRRPAATHSSPSHAFPMISSSRFVECSALHDTRKQTRRSDSMAKAKTPARKQAAKSASRQQGQAMPRSMQHRGAGDRRKAVQAPKSSTRAAQKSRPRDEGYRVTHETEVRGTETRIERVVERAPRPSLPDVDRSRASRGRYVYCIIRATHS